MMASTVRSIKSAKERCGTRASPRKSAGFHARKRMPGTKAATHENAAGRAKAIRIVSVGKGARSEGLPVNANAQYAGTARAIADASVQRNGFISVVCTLK